MIKRIAEDYTFVFQTIGKNISSHPLRAAAKVSAGLALYSVHKENPNEQFYNGQITQYARYFSDLPRSSWNIQSYDYFQTMLERLQDGRINFLNFIFFSIVLSSNERQTSRLYKAQYFSYHLWFSSLYSRVIDVGFLGKFYMLEKNKKDYDIPLDYE